MGRPGSSPGQALEWEDICLRIGVGQGVEEGWAVGEPTEKTGRESPLQTLPCWTQTELFRPLKQLCWCFHFRFAGAGESQPSECKAMAGKGSTGYSINLPYRDLASEVMRRRITMTRRYSWDLWWGLGWNTHANAHQGPRTASRFRFM